MKESGFYSSVLYSSILLCIASFAGGVSAFEESPADHLQGNEEVLGTIAQAGSVAYGTGRAGAVWYGGGSSGGSSGSVWYGGGGSSGYGEGVTGFAADSGQAGRAMLLAPIGPGSGAPYGLAPTSTASGPAMPYVFPINGARMGSNKTLKGALFGSGQFYSGGQMVNFGP